MFRALLLYYLAFFALTFVWPIWRFWRREGINPLVFANADGAYGFVVFWFKLLIVAVFALVGVLAAGLDPALLGPMSWLDLSAVQWVGVICFVISVPIIALAQVQMGRSWRIGIDQQRKTELVTGGIFMRTRNPIFLGMRINLLGLFLFLPNAATFAIWIAGELLMGLQVRLEEAHLSKANGANYADYSCKVRRWI